jgi:hypothetical protein
MTNELDTITSDDDPQPLRWLYVLAFGATVAAVSVAGTVAYYESRSRTLPFVSVGIVILGRVKQDVIEREDEIKDELVRLLKDVKPDVTLGELAGLPSARSALTA